MIKNEQLKKSVDAIIFEFATKNLDLYIEHGNALMNVVTKLAGRRKVKDLYNAKDIFDIFYASAYLYQLFYEENKISTLFLLRERTPELFIEHGVDLETQNRIFQMCECFLGEDAPADFLIPQKGYPDDLFADAVYIFNTYINKGEQKNG